MISPLESLGKNLLKLVCSHLDQDKDLYSVAKCSARLFVPAHSVRVFRLRAQKFITALVARNFNEVSKLLEKDPSLARTPLRFKANSYFQNDCPEMLMNADMFACWLGDEPMMAEVMKSANITPKEREMTLEHLGQRRPMGDAKTLDGGSTFNFSELFRVTEKYESDRSEENLNEMISAFKKCPRYVLDAAAWVYYKKMNDAQVGALNVRSAANYGRNLNVYHVHEGGSDSPSSFLHLLNRISHTSIQNLNFVLAI